METKDLFKEELETQINRIMENKSEWVDQRADELDVSFREFCGLLHTMSAEDKMAKKEATDSIQHLFALAEHALISLEALRVKSESVKEIKDYAAIITARTSEIKKEIKEIKK